MSRTCATRVCRSFSAALGILLVSGCGRATPHAADSSRARPAELPAAADADVRFIAAPIADSRLVRAAYPAMPLPPIEDSDADVAKSLGREEDATDKTAGAPPDNAVADLSGRARAIREPKTESADELQPPVLPPAFAPANPVASRSPSDPRDDVAPLAGASEPTPELIAVARQADEHIVHGIKMAARGATYTARAEFVQALRLSVAALDAQRRTTAHSRALAKAFRALDEAEDFARATAVGHLDSMAGIVRGHHTPVLQEEALDELTPSQALQRYFAYAQQQFAAAAGDLQPAASALYALGKLETSGASPEIGSLEFARAAIYFQAAMIINPQHALAANEMGVLLARHGRLAEAKAALLYSVRTFPQAAAWRNLAIVHRGLGEIDLAQRADAEWQRAAAGPRQAPADPGAPAVQWVDPATFAQSTRVNDEAPLATGTTAPPPTGAKPIATQPAAAGVNAPNNSSAGKSASLWPMWTRATR